MVPERHDPDKRPAAAWYDLDRLDRAGGKMRWQLQQAKQKFSQVVRQALEEGPQTVTRHGEDVVIVVSVKEFERLKEHEEPKMSFDDFLRSPPYWDDAFVEELERIRLERRNQYPREIEL